MDLPTVNITLGGQDLNLYLADTPRDWSQGLVGRDLADVDGMCFRFDADVHHAFHMAGVSVPILIAFFSYGGDFVDATWLNVDAQPYRPARPYRYVLELIGDHATPAGAFPLLPALLDGIAPP